MSGSQLALELVMAAGGAFIAIVLTAICLPRAPARLLRTNINGHQVAAVLGLPVAIAGMLPPAIWAVLAADGDAVRVGASAIAVLVVLGAAGSWDDFRGAELPRGFRGHLDALRTRRLTGGLVKLIAGGVVGLAVGATLTDGDPAALVRIALTVALAANLINLLDRAPGRAGKSALIVGLPLMAFGTVAWAVAAAATLGALAAVLPVDLRERGMLGDAGANAIGGLLGLGLALSLGSLAGWLVVGALVALNVASEMFSFSRVIERNRWLHRIDLAGRKAPGP